MSLSVSSQEHNAKHVPELFIDIASAMGISGVEKDSKQAISKVLDRIRYDQHATIGHYQGMTVSH